MPFSICNLASSFAEFWSRRPWAAGRQQEVVEQVEEAREAREAEAMPPSTVAVSGPNSMDVRRRSIKLCPWPDPRFWFVHSMR